MRTPIMLAAALIATATACAPVENQPAPTTSTTKSALTKAEQMRVNELAGTGKCVELMKYGDAFLERNAPNGEAKREEIQQRIDELVQELRCKGK